MITIKLALSYMKRQKEKTIAVLSGIGLAVMLIFSMFVIRDSGYDSQMREAKNLHGDYTLFFDDLDKNTVKKLEEQKEIKKLIGVKYLCEIVNTNNGVTLDLNTYDREYIDSLNYKFIGREPMKDGEIVIEEKAIQQMGIKDPLNKDIDLMLLNKYLDKNNIPQIDSGNKKFKIVGLLHKPDKYYEALNGFKSQAFITEESKLPISKIEDKYKGNLYLKDEKNKSQFVNKMYKELNLHEYNLYYNIEVKQAEYNKLASKYSIENIQNSIILIIVSSLVMYNVLNIILADMINQIGMLRAIGMPNKKIKRMFRVLSLIYIIVGTLIGMLAGSIFSYIGVRIVYGYSSTLSIDKMSILYSFLVSIIAVTISNFIIVRKSLKMSIIDSIKKSDKYEKRSRKSFSGKEKTGGNVLIKFVNRNIWRNKSRTILTITAMCLVGVLFIETSVINDLMKLKTNITSGLRPISYGNIDITLTGNIRNTEDIFYNINDTIIQKIKKEKGVKKAEPIFYNKDSFLSINKEKVSSDLINELKQRDQKYDSDYDKEYPLLVKGYNDNLLKNIDSFVDKGKNIIDVSSGDYKKVILVNNIYSRVIDSYSTEVINDVKVGDILEIKLPIYRDGLEKYEKFKVEVAGIMKNSYIATQDGDPEFLGGQVIFREEDYKELTNQQNYNKLFVMVDDGKLEPVEEKIEQMVKDYSFSLVGGKNEDKKYTVRTSEKKLGIIYQTLMILILSVNIIVIVRSNIVSKIKELSILRAIGMSTKSLKKIILLESNMYGIITSALAAIIGIYICYKGISGINSASLEAGYTQTVSYVIPFKQILTVFIVSIIMCFIAVYISKDKIENLNITEGISKNE
ncbi:ABC transporter permease protein [Gottschalkia acidurici 9a]|uniref:ABC transporter permease protein n=1 Tax=Gottschalkia acidurici (strain ATCC 7906 / DSM 604 / BCRC 14475 / CIP 104303 / KCTC 5404 / NCIMB 10678 / 9a) TaxID=1128398 RepID=K0AYN4_GOTA9|nr:ABC transporter permease protein [Gottschalkia acidurici 9a]